MLSIINKQMAAAGIKYQQTDKILIPGGLPAMFSINYRLYEAEIKSTAVILAIDMQSMHLTPKAIKKQMSYIESQYHCPIIYVGGVGAAHLSKRLTEQEVPHIIPGKKMYLPFIGAYEVPHLSPVLINPEHLSKQAQLICLAMLLHKLPEEFTVADAFRVLKISRPSIVTAIQELEQHSLLHRHRKATEKKHILSFYKKGKALWEHILPLLHNPCKKTVWVNELPSGHVPAGIDALAMLTDLAEKNIETYAIRQTEFTKSRIPQVTPYTTPLQLQLWSYSPDLLSDTAMPDPLSLILTLQHEQDDRVQIALKQLYCSLPW
ncbi:MAG: hypothetical protein IJ993_05195 [Akkermansia sp.]|nr:hypothetical protein [Akkermansia sp.]